MILKQIKINQFASFKDTALNLDPKITVLVGRNDVGKTSFLSRLLEQTYSQGNFAGFDQSRVPEVGKEGYIYYNTIWNFDEDDNRKFNLPQIFNVSKVDTLKISTKHRYDMVPAKDKNHSYEVNGKSFEAYKDKPSNNMLVLKDEILHLKREILPKVRYIPLSERQLLLSEFEIMFYELPQNAIDGFPSLRRDIVKTEEVLIRLMGLRGICRRVKGADKPWDSYKYSFPSNLSVEVIKVKCEEISRKMTELLKKWWDSPPDLTFTFGLANPSEYSMRTNTFIGQIKVKDNHDLPYYGTGLRWFMTFLIEYLDIQENDKSNILIFDEPANNLHPSAQKIVVQILNELSDRHQIIYATHSPFMLDWYAPHRIRVVDRDYYSPKSTKVSKFINKPYTSGKLYSNFWWPLRDSIGLSLGDIGLLGENNILVEGESDKILIANISRHHRDINKDYIDLNKISIVSLGGPNTLLAEQIIKMANDQNRRILGLFDEDKSGKELKTLMKNYEKEVFELNHFISNNHVQCENSIEDMIGIKDYIILVNEFYSEICGAWFRNIAIKDIESKKKATGKTLGKILEDYFITTFGKHHEFNKTSIAVHIADRLGNIKLENQNRFESLFKEINKKMKQGLDESQKFNASEILGL